MPDSLSIPDGRLCYCPACQRIAWADTSDCPLCHRSGLLYMPPTPHHNSNARDILRRFQAYRRGHDPRPLTDTGLSTAAIGEAIDAGINALGSLEDNSAIHLNPASQTPPVNCPLIIQVGTKLIPCQRQEWATSHADSLVFHVNTGESIHGRYPWAYQ